MPIAGLPTLNESLDMLKAPPREVVVIDEFLPSQIKLLNWKPKPDEKAILLDGGTRSGKTVGICIFILYIITKIPNVSVAFLATTEGQAILTLGETFKAVCKHYGYNYTICKIGNHPGIVLDNGSNIVIAGYQGRGVDNLLMGIPFDIIIADEARYFTPEQMGKSHSRLSGTSGIEGIQFLGLLTNPEGRDNFLYQHFIEEGKSSRIFFPSQDNKKNLKRGYLESMENELPPFMVDRLVYGIWRSAEGAIWPDLSNEVLVDDWRQDDCMYQSMGLDFGYTHEFASIFIEITGSGYLVVKDAYHNNKTDYDIHIQQVQLMAVDNGFHLPIKCYCDHQPQSISQFKKMVPHDKIVFKNALKTHKGDVCIFLYRLIKAGMFRIIKSKATMRLYNQLLSAVWDPSPGDRKIPLKKEGIADDLLDALLYSLSKAYRKQDILAHLGMKSLTG